MNILKNIITELKETKWPSKKEILQMTVYTVILCGILAAIMVGLDLVLFEIRDWFLNI
ncbi:preprotein translocase subunit SecE [Candidatus Microgenomates bacterium]|nr:preprotein translocase subunit SecE [Candidatus Microgenomates bacterium]